MIGITKISVRTTLFAFLALAIFAGCDDDIKNPVEVDTRDPSVAREWNEVLLESIRSDLARPTIHARNLWHISAAMFDAWSVYSESAHPYLLGTTVGGYTCPLNDITLPSDVQGAREQAISHAAYRLIRHRFKSSPHVLDMEDRTDALMERLGFDISDTSTLRIGLGGRHGQLHRSVLHCVWTSRWFKRTKRLSQSILHARQSRHRT
jgi:hypothetical protein